MGKFSKCIFCGAQIIEKGRSEKEYIKCIMCGSTAMSIYWKEVQKKINGKFCRDCKFFDDSMTAEDYPNHGRCKGIYQWIDEGPDHETLAFGNGGYLRCLPEFHCAIFEAKH